MDTNNAIGALGALAQETRLAIFRLLVRAGPNGLFAGAIGDALKVAPSSLSFHLAQLSHAGLLNQRRVGRNLVYAADFAMMNALMGYLTENCCEGAADCAPACDSTPTLAIGAQDHEALPRARRR